jgi:cyclic lactone autoinducer peptide
MKNKIKSIITNILINIGEISLNNCCFFAAYELEVPEQLKNIE